MAAEIPNPMDHVREALNRADEALAWGVDASGTAWRQREIAAQAIQEALASLEAAPSSGIREALEKLPRYGQIERFPGYLGPREDGAWILRDDALQALATLSGGEPATTNDLLKSTDVSSSDAAAPTETWTDGTTRIAPAIPSGDVEKSLEGMVDAVCLRPDRIGTRQTAFEEVAEMLHRQLTEKERELTELRSENKRLHLAHGVVERVREVAKRCGYAVGVHGSMNRDLDLIAAPWTPAAVGFLPLLHALHAEFEYVGSGIADEQGRRGICINGVPGIKYVDLSVMPTRAELGAASPQGEAEICTMCKGKGFIKCVPSLVLHSSRLVCPVCHGIDDTQKGGAE